jgi:site-specific recombinase XerD
MLKHLSQSVADFLLSYRGSKSPQTVAWYERRLKALVLFLGDVDITTISIQDLRRWRVMLSERTTRYEHHPLRAPQPGGLSAYTLHGYIRSCRHFFKWLVDEGALQRNPADRLEFPKLPKSGRKGISPSNMQRILDVAKTSGLPRDYAIVTFMADTMCRVGGMASLRIGDLDLERGRAYVREKGNKERPVYLEHRAVAAMRTWLVLRPHVAHDFVFVSRLGNPMTTGGIYQVIKRLAKAAGVEGKFNPHSWRHGGAREMVKAGVSLSVVAQFLGHEDERVTKDFYADLNDDELKAIHTQYTWLPDEPDIQIN